MARFLPRLMRFMRAAAFALLSSTAAHATSVTAISDNINGMRQLSGENIVQQYPGAAPYFGPSICQQAIPSYEAKLGPGYSCTCPKGASAPVCVPECSVLLPIYQQQAGMQEICSCPSATSIPTCRPATCGELLASYTTQYPAPAFTCGCPGGSASTQVPSCRANPTCAQMLPSMQAAYGANYACACPACSGSNDPNCYAGPSCTPIVRTCSATNSGTTVYSTTWVCQATAAGNTMNYSCHVQGAPSQDSKYSMFANSGFSGTISQGQCQMSALAWPALYKSSDPNYFYNNCGGSTPGYDLGSSSAVYGIQSYACPPGQPSNAPVPIQNWNGLSLGSYIDNDGITIVGFSEPGFCWNSNGAISFWAPDQQMFYGSCQ